MGEKRKSKIDLANHTVGFISVLMGVVIAFWLNSWSEDRKEQRTIRLALQNMKTEIKKNQTNLDSVIDKNKRQVEFLNKYLASIDEDMNIVVSQEKWKELVDTYPNQLELASSGISIQLDLYQLSGVAWATTHRTGILSSIDFELAFVLEEAYELQEKVNEFDKVFLIDLKAITNDKHAFERLSRSINLSLDLAEQLKARHYPESIKSIDMYIGE